jgi:hypothetical protein
MPASIQVEHGNVQVVGKREAKTITACEHLYVGRRRRRRARDEDRDPREAHGHARERIVCREVREA